LTQVRNTVTQAATSGPMPERSAARSAGEIRRALHTHGRATGTEKVIIRTASGNTYKVFGDDDSVVMTPQVARLMRKPGSRSYHNHPCGAEMFNAPSGSDIGITLQHGSTDTVYSESGSVYRYSPGPNFDAWRGRRAAAEMGKKVRTFCDSSEDAYMDLIVDQEFTAEAVKAMSDDEKEAAEMEIVQRCEAFRYGILLGMKDAGILNYRARLHPIDAERIIRFGKDIDKGREQVKGAFKFKAAKVEKADGRAGRDADGDGLVNERDRPTPARLTPARPRPRNRPGERPSQLLTGAAVTASGAGVAGAAAMVARALVRSPSPTIRAAGFAAAGAAGLTAAATAGFAATTAANDIAYQRRVEESAAKYGFDAPRRSARLAHEVKRAREDLRGARANYERPLVGKPISEIGLPAYKAVSQFGKATQAAFPADTQFTVKIDRQQLPERVGDQWVPRDRAVVSSSFVKGGMTGRITRTFMRDGDDLVANHDGFVINGEGKGEGIGKRVLKAQFDEYERMGVARVKVHANIDVGGYAWARFGFVPTQRSWNELRASMKAWVNSDTVLSDDFGNEYQPLKIPQRQRKALTKILDNPDPKGIWKIADARHRNRNLGKEILMERDWEGEIRPTDADAMARFNHYVGRSK
jgi:hypothetical protein